MTEFEKESYEAARRALGRELVQAELDLVAAAIAAHVAAARLPFAVAASILAVFE